MLVAGLRILSLLSLPLLPPRIREPMISVPCASTTGWYRHCLVVAGGVPSWGVSLRVGMKTLEQPGELDSSSMGRAVDDTPPAWRRYGVAVVSVGLAWALTRVAPPLHQVPSTLFFAAVTLTAFYGHLGPGLLATGLSTVAMDYSFMAPVSNLTTGVGEFVRVAAFAMASALINSSMSGGGGPSWSGKERSARARRPGGGGAGARSGARDRRPRAGSPREDHGTSRTSSTPSTSTAT